MRAAGCFLRLTAAALFATAALVPGVLTRGDPVTPNLEHRLYPPSLMAPESPYLLGADHLGRDLLTRIIYGARVTFFVSLAAVGAAMASGVALGVAAGFLRGWADVAISAALEVMLSFPALLLALAVASALGAGLLNITIVLALTSWPVYARIARGATFSLMEREFIESARAIGAANLRIMARHILPNLLSPMIVLGTLETGRIVLAEAALSYLGVGVPLTVPSWGGMLAIGQPYLATSWWAPVFPGLAITGAVVGINLLGDWLRDYLDPHQIVR